MRIGYKFVINAPKDSGSSRGNPVEVRVLSCAPFLFSMSSDFERGRNFLLESERCARCVPGSAASGFLLDPETILAVFAGFGKN
jgi:hypothetical protein